MTGAEILLLIGKLNLVAAAAILIVFALRPLARRRIGARLTYALWLLPLIAMAGSMIPPRQLVLKAVATSDAVPLPVLTGADLLAGAEGVAGPSGFTLDPIALALALWVAGVIVAAMAMARLQRRFAVEARAGGIGPAVVGLIAPRIVTPRDFATRFEPEEQALVLAHEQAHIARQDSRLNGLAAAIQCLFWFNPLIHLAIRQMRVDQELACDEAVVTRFPEARSAYARALVKTQLANRPLPLGCYWPSGTEHPLLERIAMLKTADIGARRRLVGASALALLCAASGVAAWAATPATVIYDHGGPVAPPLAVETTVTTPAPVAALQTVAKTAPVRAMERPAATAKAETIKLAQVAAVANGATSAAAFDQAAFDASAAAVSNRVTFVGDGKIPTFTPFARYFDGNSPVLIRGHVTEVRWPDNGDRGELMVVGEDGKTYRVEGGTTTTMSATQKAEAMAVNGQTIVVRGYLAHDKTCIGGCLVNGRSVTYPDGRDVITMTPASTALSQPAPNR